MNVLILNSWKQGCLCISVFLSWNVEIIIIYGEQGLFSLEVLINRDLEVFCENYFEWFTNNNTQHRKYTSSFLFVLRFAELKLRKAQKENIKRPKLILPMNKLQWQKQRYQSHQNNMSQTKPRYGTCWVVTSMEVASTSDCSISLS